MYCRTLLLVLPLVIIGCGRSPEPPTVAAPTLSQSVGIETLGGVFTPLLQSSTELPVSHTETFSTAADNQNQITIHLVRGNNQLVVDNHSLGRWQIQNIPPGPRGKPLIALTIHIDRRENVTLTATDTASRKEVPVVRLAEGS